MIVDLAAERGGNCELTQPGETHRRARRHHRSAGSTWPVPSPTTPARCTPRNVTAFLLHLVKDGKLRMDLNDEIIRETLLTRGGEVVNARVREFFALPRLAGIAREEPVMKLDLITSLYVFMLAAFIGFEVIRRVSPLLHTPLMSLTNALDAIAVVGAIILAGAAQEHAGDGARHDRDHRRHEQHRGRIHDHRPDAQDVQGERPQETLTAMIASEHIIEIAYLIATALFILSLEVDELADHGAARRLGRRAGDAAGDRRHAVPPRDRRLQVDRRRAGAGLDHRRPARAWCR